MGRLKGFYALLAVLTSLLALEGYNLVKLDGLRRAVNQPASGAVDESTPAILLFAKARYLAGAGQTDEAIRLYHMALSSEDRDLRERTHYNLANLYLQDGAKRWNARGVLDYARVTTLVELAKEHYRDALRLNPGNWDARYNLEYAWRITPPPKEKPKSDWKGTKSSVFAILPGIPGGGP